VTAFGLLGNFLNVLVLRHPYMKGISTNFYLLVLCIADIVYLILTLSLSFHHCRDSHQNLAAFYFIAYGRPATDLAGNVAVWITVVFTVERYLGVRHPIKGKIWCTVGKAKIISVFTVLFCFINTFPEVFETKIAQKQNGGYKCVGSEFSEHSSYQIGYYWWFVTIFTVIPCSCLFVFNGLLIRTLLKLSVKRRVEQHKVTLMLVTIVIIFLMCQLPWTILLLYRTYLSERGLRQPINDIRIAGNICNLLVQVNASVNFYLYSFFSRKFRKTTQKIFCRRKFADQS
ncbi:hypothetical protein LOTGIDRAFT_84528, partial [Lottia gigantea]